MKLIYPVCIIWLCLIVACAEQPTQEQANISADTAESNVAFISYSPKLQRIIKSEEGVIRGIDFGDALEEVITKEDTMPLEDSTNYVSFTVALDDKEDEITDVLYFFDKNKRINGFRVDVYLDDKRSVDSLYREFNQYFTHRYGSPVSKEAKNIAWNTANNIKIIMKDVGIKESPGLQIQINKAK